MKDARAYIESGILELYVLGATNAEETAEVEKMISSYEEIKKEVEEIRAALEKYAGAKSPAPHLAVKTLLFATLDYMERLKKGEEMSFPPELNENSNAADYNQWLQRKDMSPPPEAEDIFAKIIGHTHEMTSVIVWIKDYVPYEVHDDRFEKFLILEGTCDMITDEKTYQLKAGDYFCVPLHCRHMVKVTSATPCKAIVQRVAA
jgi:mannose-6-phosphate isomerase-like protein (cupin superfamily)